MTLSHCPSPDELSCVGKASGVLLRRSWHVLFPRVLNIPDTIFGEIISFPLVQHYSHSPSWIDSDLHVPAVCSWYKALWTQNTAKEVKSLGIIRKQLPDLVVCQTGQILRQDELWTCSVRVQNHWSRWEEIISKCSFSDFNRTFKRRTMNTN